MQAFFTCSSQYAYRLHVDPKKLGVDSNPLRIDLMIFRSSSLLARDSIFSLLLQSILSFSISVSYQEEKKDSEYHIPYYKHPIATYISTGV